MTPIKQICQEKRQHRREKMATRSAKKKYGSVMANICACEQPPGGPALEKYQDAFKRCYGIKQITCEGDQKSAGPTLYRTTPPHRRASAAMPSGNTAPITSPSIRAMPIIRRTNQSDATAFKICSGVRRVSKTPELGRRRIQRITTGVKTRNPIKNNSTCP